MADTYTLSERLDLSGRHGFAADHQIVQPAGPRESTLQCRAQDISGLAERLSGVLFGKVLQKTLGRYACPGAEQPLQPLLAQMHLVGDIGKAGLAACIGADEFNCPRDDGIVAALRFKRRLDQFCSPS